MDNKPTVRPITGKRPWVIASIAAILAEALIIWWTARTVDRETRLKQLAETPREPAAALSGGRDRTRSR